MKTINLETLREGENRFVANVGWKERLRAVLTGKVEINLNIKPSKIKKEKD